jgi:hypothetical protein
MLLFRSIWTLQSNGIQSHGQFELRTVPFTLADMLVGWKYGVTIHSTSRISFGIRPYIPLL